MSSKENQINYSPVHENWQDAYFSVVANCRGCGATALEDVWNLGEVPLANELITARAPQELKKLPLSVFFCNTCTLLQLRQTVCPEFLFSNYPYFSSVSETMQASARSCCETIISRNVLTDKSLVIEIGSNDGYLLKNYIQHGIRVLGIEPAKNIAEYALKNGIPTICEFFSLPISKQLAAEGKKADVLHANNVIAHIPDVCESFQAIAAILKENGIAILEVPYVKSLLDNCEFDTIYHEHVFYFSLTAINFLSRSAGLKVLDVEHLAIHGGTLRITLGRRGKPQNTVAKLLDYEKQWGVGEIGIYQQMSSRIQELGTRVRTLLSQLVNEGKRLAGYGASAKGTTFLSVLGIGSQLSFVADKSSAKQGCLTPGTNLRILAPSALIERSVDYTLLLAWNFQSEIIEQQTDYLKQGGAFIVPLPELRIICFDRVQSKIVSLAP